MNWQDFEPVYGSEKNGVYVDYFKAAESGWMFSVMTDSEPLDVDAVIDLITVLKHEFGDALIFCLSEERSNLTVTGFPDDQTCWNWVEAFENLQEVNQ